MTANATLRPAVAADLPTIGTLAALLVRTHHDFDPARFIAEAPETEQRYAEYVGSQLGKSKVTVIVAELNGGVVGYAWGGVEGYDYMSLRGPAGVIYDVVVNAAHRGQGVGRMLLDATLAALATRGAPRVVLSTAAKNDAAQRLFARAGFRPTMIEMTREFDTNAP